MYNNAYGYNNQYPQNGFGGFNVPGYNPVLNNVVPTHGTNPLTAEEIKSLRKHVDQFVIGLTQDEILRSICFHKNENGTPSLQSIGGDKVKCLICGKEFTFLDNISKEDLNGAVQDLLDIMQSIKLMYIDFPEQAARDFFQIIGLIEKIPALYELALEDLKKHENGFRFNFQGGPSYNGIYSAISSGFGTPGWNQYQQQPMMGGMGMNPMMGQGMAPQGNMYSGAPIGANSNGFGANPQMRYQPQAQTYGYQYQAGQQPVMNNGMMQQPMAMGMNQPNAAQAAVTAGAPQPPQPVNVPQTNQAAPVAPKGKGTPATKQENVKNVFTV